MANGRLIGVGRLNRVLSEISIRRGINVTLSEYNTLAKIQYLLKSQEKLVIRSQLNKNHIK